MIIVDHKTAVFQEVDGVSSYAGLFKGESILCWPSSKDANKFAVWIGDCFIGITDELTLDSVVELVEKTVA